MAQIGTSPSQDRGVAFEKLRVRCTGLKAKILVVLNGTAEVVPFQSISRVA